MKSKRVFVFLLGMLFLLTACLPDAALASGIQPETNTRSNTVATESVNQGGNTEGVPGEKPVSSSESTGPMAPLTPEGNMTLVDDQGVKNGVGKQFITLVTKDGNYFYLIIDRDADGKQTVHFLNQVDDADLASLLEEDQKNGLKPQLEEPQPVPPPNVEEKEETDKPEKNKEQKAASPMPALVTLLLLLGAGGIYLGRKFFLEKKQQEQEKPDPDADYDEEDLYGEEPEESSEEDVFNDTFEETDSEPKEEQF